MDEIVVNTVQDHYLDYADNFARYSHIASIPVFENRRDERPAVTIAIPTFSRVRTLEYALKSALEQDYDNYEIIVVDNNPERNDQTEEYMMQFALIEGLSYYKNTENIGLYGNWNRCFELCDSKWVTLLHDDDYYFPEYLSTMLRHLKKYPKIECLYAQHLNWIESEHRNGIDKIDRAALPRPRGVVRIDKQTLFFSHVVGPVGIIFRKENVMTLGGFNPDFYPSADYFFDFKYNLYYNIYTLNTILVHYRIGINASYKPETLEQQEYQNYMAGQSFLKAMPFKKLNGRLKALLCADRYSDYKKRFPQYTFQYDPVFGPIGKNALLSLVYKKYLWVVSRNRIRFVSYFRK